MSLFNSFANLIKVGGLKVTDLLNKVYDPFDEFSRPYDSRYDELLFAKAQRFVYDMTQNFSYMDGQIWNYKRQLDGWIDTGDQCLWHGVYTAMWAMKYGVTQDAEDLERLRLCMSGLNLHQTVHGESTRRLIRGVKPVTSQYENKPDSWWDGPQLFLKHNGYVIEDSASNDSGGGHILGIYFAWLYGDADIKQKAATLAKGFADELIMHDYSIVLSDGKPTEFGKLLNGWKTDPTRLLLCLTVLKVAAKVMGESIYEEHYKKVEKEYNKFGYTKYAKAKLFSWDTHADTHRAAFLQSILSDIEEDLEICATYMDGLWRTWQVTHKTMNVWVAFLYARHFWLTSKELGDCKTILKEFAVEDKSNIEKINSVDEIYWKNRGIKFFKWQGHLRASQPLPAWKMGAVDFKWQRHPFSVDDCVGNKIPSIFYNGGDFLACYFLGRVLGLLTDKE
jgi:hypothetical protein